MDVEGKSQTSRHVYCLFLAFLLSFEAISYEADSFVNST